MTDLIKEISTFFTKEYNKYSDFEGIGIYGGRSGVLLFQALNLIENHQNTSLEDEMFVNFDKIQAQLNDNHVGSKTFADGLAGFGWLTCYLSEIEFLETNDMFFHAIDQVLEKSIDIFLKVDKPLSIDPLSPKIILS